MDDIYPSAFVKSVAGRDKNRCFIVMSRVDDRYVFISDGKMRKVEKPKKKKVKHLRLLEQQSDFIKFKLAAGECPTNREIKSEIRRLSDGARE